MHKYYLLTILLFYALSSIGQIREIPINSNAQIQAAYQKKVIKQDIQIDDNQFFARGNCPDSSSNTIYVFSKDTAIFVLDTLNGNRYDLLVNSDDFGTTILKEDSLFFVANDIAGAGSDQIILVNTIIGDSSEFELVYDLVIKRRGESLLLSADKVDAESRNEYCVEPTNRLPGEITCNNLFSAAENYGGFGLQRQYFRSGNDNENCVIYHATRFPGLDTLAVVLCDEFTVCDTFLQPIQIVGDTVRLPFFEDFTKPGPFPQKDKWLEDLVFVNNTMPQFPPSFGVATFDGLDQSGQPYGGEFGISDILTSKPIDLSNSSVNRGVALSFYYQLRGRGFTPRIQDSLQVEFLNEDLEWVTAFAIPGSNFIKVDSVPPFQFVGIPLTDPQFFHDAFQFRFFNLGERTGAYGAWHLDYILLDENRSIITPNVDDVAFVEGTGSVLERYTSMPIKQFKDFENQELKKEVNGILYNHFSVTQNLESSTVFISEKTSGQTWPTFQFTSGQENNIQSQIGEFRQRTIPGATYDAFESDINALAASENDLQIEVLQTLQVDEQSTTRVLTNDTLASITTLSNYYAYDDGTAERALENNGANSMIAVEFESNKDDQLEAVQFHFPQVNGDYSNQRFNLMIWVGELGNAADADYIRFLRPSSPDSLQAFTTYLLEDPLSSDSIIPMPLNIPAGKFYVGWQQLDETPNPIPVGYDKNHPEGTKYIWYNTGRPQWSNFDDLPFKGSLMIRALMSGGEIDPTNTEDIERMSNPHFIIYPNPANEFINFKIQNKNFEDYRIKIFNNLGQLVFDDNFAQQIDIQHFIKGIYFAKIQHKRTAESSMVQFIKH